MSAVSRRCERPLVVRCGAFGDMVLLTALIRELHVHFRCPVDILTSGSWSEPLLGEQPEVGDIFHVRSRNTPYWLAPDKRRVARQLRFRGVGPTWFCDRSEAAWSMLTHAGITADFIVDARDHLLFVGEHMTEYWRRLAKIMPPAVRGPSASEGEASGGGCYLRVTPTQQADLDTWLRTRGLADSPLILFQVGNKRTMRRRPGRVAADAKYWPKERWAAVLRHVRKNSAKHAILLLGAANEYALNEEVATLAGIDHLYNVADDLPIPRLLALLARADALISVDSGPAHAAAAVGCPQVVLFGSASHSLYRPWGMSGAEVRVLLGQVDGKPNIRGIAPAAVIDAWTSLRLRSADNEGRPLKAPLPEPAV